MELPIEAYLGTIFLESKYGTLIKCYSYIDPDFKLGYEYYNKGLHQQIILVEFKNLHRRDKAFLQHWSDFTFYDLESYHNWISNLLKYDFIIKLI